LHIPERLFRAAHQRKAHVVAREVVQVTHDWSCCRTTQRKTLRCRCGWQPHCRRHWLWHPVPARTGHRHSQPQANRRDHLCFAHVHFSVCRSWQSIGGHRTCHHGLGRRARRKHSVLNELGESARPDACPWRGIYFKPVELPAKPA
jgi:hypothetical protein